MNAGELCNERNLPAGIVTDRDLVERSGEELSVLVMLVKNE